MSCNEKIGVKFFFGIFEAKFVNFGQNLTKSSSLKLGMLDTNYLDPNVSK
jgi:hypothetical protein